VQLIDVIDAAVVIVNVAVSLLGAWFASPAKFAVAVAVPAAVLFV